jgi:5-methylcytosine-specific restriction endonuclease McrA
MPIRMVPEKDIHITNSDGTDYVVFLKGQPVWVWDGRVAGDKIWRRFRRMVFERDHYTCRECGNQDRRRLRVHHVKPVRDFPNLYYDLDNTLTLCVECHGEIPKKGDYNG